MPFPKQVARPQPSPPAPAAATEPRPLLFVSYSHRDMAEYADAFVRFLTLKLRAAPQLSYAEGDIFFDRHRLIAGEEWDPCIETALERAGALVFLVSDNSLFSRYCMERELRMAVTRSIRIIPVVLCECPWEDQPLPGDPARRRLGDLGALPKDESFSLRPVCNWSNRNMAWNTVVQQIVQALGEPQEPAALPLPNARTASSATAAVPPLLPYFCNQVAAERTFNEGLRRWDKSALMILVKGVLDDRPPQFWARLRHKNLMDLVSKRQQRVLDQRPLKWPPGWDGARLYKSIATDVCSALSDALSGNQFDIDCAASLAARLEELGGVLPLMATLPREPSRALAGALRALLELLENVPEGAPLERLVLTFIIEDEVLIAGPGLLKTLKPDSWRRTRIVELEPLRMLTDDDVRRWHRDHEVGRYCGLDEKRVIDHVFSGGASSLRFAQFEARLSPLLGLKGMI